MTAFDASQPLVSIVLPCYNVEPYIAQCLASLTAQTYAAVEIVAIDDGSTDGTLALLKEARDGDPRIRIIAQPNAGLGAGRNTGFAAARGKYLTFVDSDDYIAPDAVSKLTAAAEANDSDVVISRRLKFRGERILKPDSLMDSGAREMDVPVTTWAERPYIGGRRAIHGKLHRTSFLRKHNLTSQLSRSAQDVTFSLRSYMLARRITLIPDVTYYYRRGVSDSLSAGKLKPRSLEGRFLQCDTVYAMLRGAPAGRPLFSERRFYKVEFGMRLMGCIAQLRKSDRDEAGPGALMIGDFSRAYADGIRRYCDARAVAVYEALWAADLDATVRALEMPLVPSAGDPQDDGAGE